MTVLYAKKHNIVFNSSKSTGMLFKPKQFSLSTSPTVLLGNMTVCFSDSVTYLGVKLNSSLTDNDDILRQVRSVYCAANKLKAKFSKCSLVVKNVLFRSYCTQFYCSQLWNHFSKSSYQRIKVAYNDSYRILHNVPRFISARELQVHNNVITFDALLRKSMFGFVKRCLHSDNHLMSSLIHSDVFYKSPFYQYFSTSLYCPKG